ncbi:MAG: nucleoside triphosphate pyrophosphohydrolase family protein [Bacteroidota bacterium]|nr:nucleoside triphosphate pyrophosphohydrolase family protein [Bacteroidota bacterium]MDX5447219.1 nucleoside triphosphate pyrophosphohydrolase family protein [Bacteroidota bacterium]
MKKQIDHVARFHELFLIGNEDSPRGNVDQDTFMLRYKLMREENEEYLEAAEKGDLVEIADALGDMMYILCGTILKHGLQNVIEEVFEEIQRSNLSKLGADGKPIYREDGKVLKGENYFRPDIRGILEQKGVKI